MVKAILQWKFSSLELGIAKCSNSDWTFSLSFHVTFMIMTFMFRCLLCSDIVQHFMLIPTLQKNMLSPSSDSK